MQSCFLKQCLCNCFDINSCIVLLWTKFCSRYGRASARGFESISAEFGSFKWLFAYWVLPFRTVHWHVCYFLAMSRKNVCIIFQDYSFWNFAPFFNILQTFLIIRSWINFFIGQKLNLLKYEKVGNTSVDRTGSSRHGMIGIICDGSSRGFGGGVSWSILCVIICVCNILIYNVFDLQEMSVNASKRWQWNPYFLHSYWIENP